MKMHTDKNMLSYSRNVALAMVVCPIMTIVSRFVFSNNYMTAAFLTFTFVLILFGPAMLFFVRRRAMYSIKREKEICSYSMFGRLCCTVNLERTVYCAEFVAKRDREDTKYYAISNDVFVITQNGFLSCYDFRKVIVLPHDETLGVVNRQEWIRMN